MRSAEGALLRVTDSIILDDSEIGERFVRAIGPGGANARKEQTAERLFAHAERHENNGWRPRNGEERSSCPEAAGRQ